MKKFVFPVFFLLSLCLPERFSAQVIINEIMAKNVSTTADMVDFDDFSDWIEIRNTQNTSVDLSNYFLTDNLADPYKWKIPAGTIIPANGFLLFWADGYDSEPGKSYIRDYWPWDNFTTQRYHTNFKLSASGEELGMFKLASIKDSIVLSKNSLWKYLDDGSNQGSSWKEFAFDDSQWNSGYGQLGYGDGDENTVLSYGGNSSDKYITTYFRTEISIENIAQIISAEFNILRDDGAAVYLNGNEIFRTNLPDGDILYNTHADAAIGGSDESTYYSFKTGKEFLQNGVNVIAVELHQANATSSDISFDMEIIFEKANSNAIPELIDSVTFDYQQADVSLGRNSSGDWKFWGEPTPGESNSGNYSENNILSGSVIITPASGIYNAAQSVNISASAGEIHYTLDGSKPTSESPVYTSPFIVYSNTVVRARTFESGKIPGKVSSASFLINEPESSIPVASVIAEPKFFWDSTLGIYQNNWKGKTAPVSIQYFYGSNLQFNIDAGAKIGGFNIWRFAEKPLNISLDSDYGQNLLNYKLFDNKLIASFTSFEFRNGGDNWPTTLLQDAMTESLLKDHMKNGCQAYRPINVYINGEYWGIHNLRERFDGYYFNQNFGADPNNYEHLRTDLLGPDGHLGMRAEMGSLDGYNSMIAYAAGNDLSIEANYKYMQSLMDIDSFIDFLVGEIYVCNTSWRHNREWWRLLKDDTKWYWLLPDIDRGFNINNTSQNILDDIVSEYDLLKALLQNTKFKNRFIQKFAAHLNSTFKFERVAGIIDSLSAVIEPEMQRHIDRWASEGGIGSMTAWLNNLQNMKSFSSQRISILYNQINSEFNLSGTVNLTVDINKASAGKILLNDVPLTEGLTNIKVFKNTPLVLKAITNPGFRFTGWNNNSAAQSIELTLNSDSTLTASFSETAEQILPAKISSNMVLTKSGSPYVLSESVEIESGVELKIENGVRLKMEENSILIVKGRLVINGTAEYPVEISPNESTESTFWKTIFFDNASDTCFLNHVILSGATKGDDPVSQPGAISALNSNLVIDNIEIKNVEYGIFIQEGSVSLTNSKLSAYGICDYINVKRGKALVDNNYFFGNKSPDTDAIDYDGVMNGKILNNRIFNFRGSNSDGIDIGESCNGVEISGNRIFHSTDKGISVGQKSTVQISYNLIVGCNLGVAIKDSSNALIDKNTFYFNNFSVVCFEKNHRNGGGTAQISNCLFSESKSQSVFADDKSQISQVYSLSDTEILEGLGNLYANPEFVDRFSYNFELADTSVCIDAGNPANFDLDGSISDIGGYYNYSPTDYPDSLRLPLKSKIRINEIMYNDSPDFNSGDWIELYNTSASEIDLSNWQITDEDSIKFFYFANSTIIHPNEYFIICKDTSAFKSVYPEAANIFGNLDFGFDGTDKVLLLNSSSELEAFVSYDNNFPWPSEPDGNGNTLEMISLGMQNYTSLNWAKSINLGGSPGKENSVYILNLDQESAMPQKFELSQNYPNPFNPSTLINYSLTERTIVHLSVFNILGQKVKELVNEIQNPGFYQIDFDASHLASGIYIYSIRTKLGIISRKMMLLK